MRIRTPNIKIDKIDKIEINPNFLPSDTGANARKILSNLFQKEKTSTVSKSGLLKSIDIISKIVSILSGIGVIVFIILLIAGKTHVGTVQISKLLTIISFTLIGGIISIGGVKMFSFNASFQKRQTDLEKLIKASIDCPFACLVDSDNPNYKDYEPGNPQFCQKCPLGIDKVNDESIGLINVCKVYMDYYKKWQQKKDNGIDKTAPNKPDRLVLNRKRNKNLSIAEILKQSDRKSDTKK